MAVYFIAEEGTEGVKIGTTGDVWRRMGFLQSKNDRQLILMRVIEGDFEVERAAHERFSHLRVKGEWFAYCDQMWDFGGPSIDIGKRHVHQPAPRIKRISFDQISQPIEQP